MGMTKKHKRVFDMMHEVAKPGDILFMTGHVAPEEMTLSAQLKRAISGYDSRDDSTWHTAMYLGKTESGNAEIAEAVVSGVRVQHLPSNYYTKGRRLELARIHDVCLTDPSRERIVETVRNEVGKGFDRRGIYGIPLQRLLGLPNFLAEEGKYTCQGLVLSILERQGIDLKGLHPTGILDRDLYNHPKLEILLSVEEFEGDVLKVTSMPEKYSWNSVLRMAYKM